MSHRAVSCAVTFRDTAVQAEEIPLRFDSPEDAIGRMMNSLLFEAHESMKEPRVVSGDATLISEDALPFRAVDVDTPEPGVLTKPGQTKVVRFQRENVPHVTYERTPLPARESTYHPTDKGVELGLLEETKRKRDTLKKRDIRKLETRAKREAERDEACLEKERKKEERKRRIETETKEEKAVRVAMEREEREEKKREREERKRLRSENAVSKTKAEGPDKVQPTQDPQEDGPETEDASSLDQEKDMELELEEVASVVDAPLLPPKLRKRETKAKVFASPIPFDRHLTALQVCSPPEDMLPALLRGEGHESLLLVHGPPGTGKTTHLVTMARDMPDMRILMCAPSNVAASNLHERATSLGITSSLVIPQERVPPGTVVHSTDPCGRVVCSTLSSRSGPLLKDQSFDVILVDEAGKCCEAMVWGLLRSEVKKLVLAGDTMQLGAITSEEGTCLGNGRSMLERLTKLGYQNSTLLDVQRRIHPDIFDFVNKAYYSSLLTTQYTMPDPPIHTTTPPFLVLNTSESEEEKDGSSFKNKKEAELMVGYARMLSLPPGRIVLLSPYKAQCREIMRLRSGHEVHTVDSFQGREADVILLSTVRTSDLSCGFWSDEKRLVVALTRARHKLAVFGKTDSWSGPLKDMLDDAKGKGLVRSIR